jgi:P27 family predicted phage terminase small subunit
MKRPPPNHLSKESKQIWSEIVKGWEILESDFTVLRIALESFDRLQEARRVIDKEGMILVDGKGKKYAHPALAVEKESRTGLLRAWRQLGLDLEPPQPVGRPPGR